MVPAGWRDLDSRIGGLPACTLTVVGGRSGTGRTYVVLQLLLQAARAGFPGTLVSLKWIQGKCSGDCSRRLRGKTQSGCGTDACGRSEEKRVRDAVDALARLPLRLVFSSNPSCAHITELLSAAHAFGTRLAAVDHLTLIHPASAGAQRHDQALGQVVSSIRDAARGGRMAVVGIAQTNRQSERRSAEGKSKPQLSDLYNSGEIEHHADLVLLLQRQEGRRLDLHLVKVRHGAGGGNVVALQMGDHGEIRDAPGSVSRTAVA